MASNRRWNHVRIVARALAIASVLACAHVAQASVLRPFDQGTVGYSVALFTFYSHDAQATATTMGSTVMPLGGVRLGDVRQTYVWFNVPAGLRAEAPVTLSFDVHGASLEMLVELWSLDLPYAAYEVSYSPPALLQPTPPGVLALFDDVQAGTRYAGPLHLERNLDGIDVALTFELPATALAGIDAARGGTFGIGITGTPEILSATRVIDHFRLTIGRTDVPAPVGPGMIAAAFAGVLGLRRRQTTA